MVSIGIDLSINSTGLVIDEGDKIKYYIITSKDTKKLREWNDDRVNVVVYHKEAIDKKNSTYSEVEYHKTHNIITIANTIYSILRPYKDQEKVRAYIEGISYGSSKTSALADLAGLNYMVRYVLYQLGIITFIVSPMENKKFACGIGNADKDIMVAAWLKCQPDMIEVNKMLKSDDIADAYFLSQYHKKK